MDIRAFAAAAALMMFAIAACTHAGDTVSNMAPTATTAMDQTMLINEMTPPHAGTASDAQRDDEAQKRLSQWLVTYLKDEYHIRGSRFFNVKRNDFQWVSVWKNFANQIQAPHEACLERQAWNRPGYDLVTLWRMPAAPYTRIAVAALNDDSVSSGLRLVGYFQLERIETSRNDAALAEEIRPCGTAGPMDKRIG